MTSQINVLTIDATYPIAGQDNSSQGFRDNFANIKIALTTATNEISALQLDTVKLGVANDFGFAGTIDRAIVRDTGFVAINVASVAGDLDFSEGSYHKSAITTATTFYGTNWPATGIYANLRLEVKPASSATTSINFSGGAGTLVKESSLTLPYVSTSTSSTLWDLHTSDGGDRVFLKFVGGPFE